jgi:hypothetical protein
MLKNKKFWNYESCQSYELKQEIFDNYKVKGRISEDINHFYELIGVGTHPGLKISFGKEHQEISSLAFISVMVDINTLKILFFILQNFKIVSLKFSSNNFTLENFDFLVNSLNLKPNNIFSLAIDWNGSLSIDGNNVDLSEVDKISEPKVAEELSKFGQLICKLSQSPKLEQLSLRASSLGNGYCITIFENLKLNQNLKVLNLYKNNLTSGCIPGLCGMLEVNRKLEEINLGANLFIDEDLEVLKKYIGKLLIAGEDLENYNKKLKEKEAIIEKNKKLKTQKKPEEPLPFVEELTIIGDQNYIVKNVSIKSLNFMLNKFTGECFQTLVSILESNSELGIIIDAKLFNKQQRENLNEVQFASRVYLTK